MRGSRVPAGLNDPERKELEPRPSSLLPPICLGGYDASQCRSGLGPLYAKFGFEELDVEQMPLFFRRMTKLVSIVNHLRRTDEYLMVMAVFNQQ
jgi:hypothetical protein